jgi:hypothetical protein
VVFLAISALADTTFVVFPLGSFGATSFADDEFRIVTWLSKILFVICGLYENFYNDFVNLTAARSPYSDNAR